VAPQKGYLFSLLATPGQFNVPLLALFDEKFQQKTKNNILLI
jgi:glucan phosphoethanolaminetransferase (alkaline phosphatase superfamily)